MPFWFNDFQFKNGKVYVKATDTTLSLNFALISEVLRWIPFSALEQVKRAGRRLAGQRGPKIAYRPAPPRPWYLLRAAADRANARVISDIEAADAVFYFEDQTIATPPPLPAKAAHKAYNFRCGDISKSNVGKVFAHVFGYSISVDPRTFVGDMAVKSEKNGVHDGAVIRGPLKNPDPKLCYQRLINTSSDGIYVKDLRCPSVGGDIPLVYIKKRPIETRFANFNSHVELVEPQCVFSEKERGLLKVFAAKMGLDWGGMDVLRDETDGRIYVVDVNKTDMGPPITLSLKDKTKSVKILSAQLLDFIGYTHER